MPRDAQRDRTEHLDTLMIATNAKARRMAGL